MEHFTNFPIINVINIQSFMNTMNKILVSNINKHHNKTINSYIRSVLIWWRHHHGTILWKSILCDVMRICFIIKCNFKLCIFNCLKNGILHHNTPISCKTSIIQHYDNTTISCPTKHVIMKRGYKKLISLMLDFIWHDQLDMSINDLKSVRTLSSKL